MNQYQWQRSSRCASGDSCVYVATSPGGQVLVAASGEPAAGAVLRVSTAAWSGLLGALKAGRL